MWENRRNAGSASWTGVDKKKVDAAKKKEWLQKLNQGKRGQKGFTLIELMIVLAMVTIVLAMVGPGMWGYLGELFAVVSK
jgi:prepilin-type N-terminal cleavage/methylation domain-containing protein